MNELDSRTIRRIAAIQAAITHKSLSANELAEAICITPQSALEYIRHLMQGENKRIYITNWKRTPGHIYAAYRWGNGKDAAKPAGKTKAQSQRERIQRLRKDGYAYDRYLAMHRARYAREKAMSKPNTWLSALGGGV